MKEISEHNILALTGHCNCRCLFCSHGNNPRGTKIFRPGARELSVVLKALDFLDPHRRIVIGESASPISEGEPFLYPHLMEVLCAIRKKFPVTPIALTTNGTKLTAEMISRLAEIGNVSLCLSLNTLEYRKALMGDCGDAAVKAPPLLCAAGIPFEGSMVLMPEVTGWEDIKNTLAYLHRWGAAAVRVILPGFGAMADPCHTYDFEKRRRKALKIIKEQTGITFLEPPLYANHLPFVYGVYPDSLGERAGLRKGDLLLSVNGKAPRNRYEGWQLLQEAAACEIVVRRENKALNLSLSKSRGEASGAVFENDLELGRLEEMAAIFSHRRGRALICCSALGRPYLEANRRLFPVLEEIPLVTVENRYFGGNLGAAGLLVIADFEAALKDAAVDYVFLPRECFSVGGEDLTGHRPEELSVKAFVL